MVSSPASGSDWAEPMQSLRAEEEAGEDESMPRRARAGGTATDLVDPRGLGDSLTSECSRVHLRRKPAKPLRNAYRIGRPAFTELSYVRRQ